jgi:HlyD family secretion protein
MPKQRLFALIAALVIALAGAGGYGLWLTRTDRLPDGIVAGNGRLEADEIDITPKFPGRIAALLVEEGDMVTAGQIVARMDTRDLEADLSRVQAQIAQAGKTLDAARADVSQREAQVRLAGLELDRAQALVKRDFVSRQVVDQRLNDRDSANALLAAARAQVGAAEHAVDVATREAERIKVDIADGVLVAPRAGRVLYRLVNIGEVIGAGAKIFTILDVTNVYMTIFLPTDEAGRVPIGAPGRIIVDAYPNLVIPATVSFVSAKSQFTPKTVETRTEREKLMFRLKVRVDPDLLARHAEQVRTGLPGIAYVLADPKVEWPARLQANAR